MAGMPIFARVRMAPMLVPLTFLLMACLGSVAGEGESTGSTSEAAIVTGQSRRENTGTDALRGLNRSAM